MEFHDDDQSEVYSISAPWCCSGDELTQLLLLLLLASECTKERKLQSGSAVQLRLLLHAVCRCSGGDDNDGGSVIAEPLAVCWYFQLLSGLLLALSLVLAPGLTLPPPDG